MDRFQTKEQLIEALSNALQVVPGVSYNFTQPMAMRLDETISGIKADVAVKIYGEDPRTLTQLAERYLRIVGSVQGAADSRMEMSPASPSSASKSIAKPSPATASTSATSAI